MSATQLVSPGTRFAASESKATNLPSALTDTVCHKGLKGPTHSCSELSRLTRSVLSARAGSEPEKMVVQATTAASTMLTSGREDARKSALSVTR